MTKAKTYSIPSTFGAATNTLAEAGPAPLSITALLQAQDALLRARGSGPDDALTIAMRRPPFNFKRARPDVSAALRSFEEQDVLFRLAEEHIVLRQMHIERVQEPYPRRWETYVTLPEDQYEALVLVAWEHSPLEKWGMRFPIPQPCLHRFCAGPCQNSKASQITYAILEGMYNGRVPMARIRTSDIGDQRSLRAMQDLLKPEHVRVDEVTRDPRSQSLVVFARFDHQSKSEARRVAIAEAAAYDADLDAFSSEAIVARVLDALYNDV